MEPLSATVVAIVTGYLTRGIEKVTQQVGAAASNAARTLAEAVLERLREDPAEAKNADRYEQAPEDHQKTIEAAVADLVAADEAFAARLESLVATFETEAKAPGVNVRVRDVDGNLVFGNDNLVLNDNYGTIDARRGPS